MFSIFKSKKTFLKDLTVDFTDIHSHVLFGIDDGAKTVKDSEFLMNSFKDLGFKNAIATPHTLPEVWDNTYEGITQKYYETKELLPEISQKLNLKVASEYLLDDSFMKRFQSEKLLTLKDNFVLVEMSYINAPIQLYDIIFELQIAGYKPVLAHPERYLFFHQKFNEYKKLQQSGCLLQINLLSTVGYYGEHITKIADKLLAENLIVFAGSDVHHEKHIEAFENELKIKNKNIKALKQAIQNTSFFE